MKRYPLSCLWALLVLAACTLVFRAVSAAPEGQNVALRTSDGVTIIGSYYVPHKPGKRPAVILLHMLNRTRSDWEEFATVLAREGYAVLSIDLRGHGDSTKGVGSWRVFSLADFQAMTQDVAAARDFLKQASEADTDRLAVIGASIGANVALVYGGQEPEVKSLVLLSPGLDYRGVATAEAMKAYGKRSVLLVASREDDYSAESSSALDAVARGHHRLLLYTNAGHGTRMFEKVDTLEATILKWLDSTI